METTEIEKNSSTETIKETSNIVKLPTKQKQEIFIPYEKENYSTIEKAIIELSEELSNLTELRDSIEHSFSKKNLIDDKFQGEVTSLFNSLIKQIENQTETFKKEIDYNKQLEIQIQNKEYQGQIFILDRALNEERAKISKTLIEITDTVKETMIVVSEKCKELKLANNIIEENIMKFRSDSMAATENEYKALKNQCESLLKTFTENAKTTLETVKKTSIDFITQCEKENKSLIGKVPSVKGKLTTESWIVIIFGCLGLANIIINFFM